MLCKLRLHIEVMIITCVANKQHAKLGKGVCLGFFERNCQCRCSAQFFPFKSVGYELAWTPKCWFGLHFTPADPDIETYPASDCAVEAYSVSWKAPEWNSWPDWYPFPLPGMMGDSVLAASLALPAETPEGLRLLHYSDSGDLAWQGWVNKV